MLHPKIPGLKNLTTHGGKGQPGIERINGSVLTIRETAAKTLALDIIKDTSRRTHKPLTEIPFIEFLNDVNGRCDNRIFKQGEVMAEIGRIQNHAIRQGRL